MSRWGGTGDVFAPPCVVDGVVDDVSVKFRRNSDPAMCSGDFVISQSTAAALYLGKKLGLIPAGYNEFKAMQVSTPQTINTCVLCLLPSQFKP